PLGARLKWARGDGPWMTIVGVVGDVRQLGADRPDQPAVYDSYLQTGQQWKRWMTLVLRGTTAPPALAREAKDRLWALDPQLPPTRVATMEEVMSTSLDARRFSLTLMSLFAVVALALAAIGLYGVTAYGVTQRAREIGIRIALGARRRDIARLVLVEGGRLVAAGAALRAPGALAATRLLDSLLVGVSSRDPGIFGAVAAILLAVAALACWLPARRAGRVDPMIALKS